MGRKTVVGEYQYLLDPELGRAWIAALRSGRYAQTRGTLRETWQAYYAAPAQVRHCAMGVICDVYGKPPELLGLDNALVQRVIQLNDDEHYSFARIANWLERWLPPDEPAEPEAPQVEVIVLAEDAILQPA